MIFSVLSIKTIAHRETCYGILVHLIGCGEGISNGINQIVQQVAE